ncbi:MAG: NHLP leader peptide family RiPP precursor [Phycisphaerales bacterium]|jgi:hypothetical protein
MKNVTAMLAPLLQDPAFKAKLIADPKAAFAERGIKVPERLTIKVLENTPTVFHLVLPSTTASSDLTDEELAAAAGGAYEDVVEKTFASECVTCPPR